MKKKSNKPRDIPKAETLLAETLEKMKPQLNHSEIITKLDEILDILRRQWQYGYVYSQPNVPRPYPLHDPIVTWCGGNTCDRVIHAPYMQRLT